MTNITGWKREEMAALAADDIPDGSCVNLGIGIPELVAQFVSEDKNLLYHTENGLMGMGPAPAPGDEDPELINAGKKPVTAIPGASFFHHADSFAMIRGGHVDVCILGALQVARNGDLANWSTEELGVSNSPSAARAIPAVGGARSIPAVGGVRSIPAVGGAMDLVAGVKTIFVMTSHCTKTGAPKLVEACSYPLTGARVVTKIFTDLAVIDVTPDGFIVRKLAPNVSFDDVVSRTAAAVLDGTLN